MKDFFYWHGLEGNFLKFAIGQATNKRIFAAILGAYYLTVPGSSPFWVGVILFSSSVAGFVFEIPSGYLADKMGHKQALVTSRSLMVVSTLLFLFANSITFLIIAGVFHAISIAFLSGTGTAFIHETTRALGREKDFREILGKISSLGFGAPIILSVLAPFLVAISWKLPFLFSLVFDLIGLFVTCLLVVPPVTPEHVEEVRLTNFRQVLEEGYRRKFFRYALFSGTLLGLMFAVGGFRGVYQIALGIPVIWFGVLFGLGRAGASVLLWYTGRLQKVLKTGFHIYLFKFSIFFLLVLALGLVENTTVIATLFILINAFQWGLNSLGYTVEVVKDSKFKATLLSVKSQMHMFIAAIISLGFGALAEIYSYRETFLILAGVLVLTLLPMLYFISRDKRNGAIGGDVDFGE